MGLLDFKLTQLLLSSSFCFLQSSSITLCVESVALIGSDKDQIKVTGEGIDSVELVMLLRKGVGCTQLVSVGSVEEEKPTTTTAAASQTPATVVPLQVYPHHYSRYGGPYYHVYESPSNEEPSCTIM